MRSPHRFWWVVVLGLSASAWAGEGYMTTTGERLYLSGYGWTSDELAGNAPLALEINLRVWVKGGSPEWVDLSSSDPEIQNLVVSTAVAMGLWENVAHCRIDFTFGIYRTKYTMVKDGLRMVSLAGGTYSYGGDARFWWLSGDYGATEIGEADHHLSRADNKNDSLLAQASLAQELGHGIGLNHSWLCRDVVLGVTGWTSLPALMAYGDGKKPVVLTGVLSMDDVSTVCRLYPDHSDRLSKSTGTIRGRFVNGDGTMDLYGGLVVLVDALGGAYTTRISGYWSSDPSEAESPKNGCFELEAVPAGTWDVLVAARKDPQIVTAGAELDNVKIDADGHCTYEDAATSLVCNFLKGWVRNVHVGVGEVVDVGLVRAAEDRDFGSPSLIDVTMAAPTSPSCPWYQYNVWAVEGWKFVKCDVVSSSTHRVRLAPGAYYTQVLGYLNGVWVTLQDWTWHDYTVRLASMTWNRAHHAVGGSTLEATSYFLTDKFGGATWNYTGRIDGTKYTTHLVPGPHLFRVQAQWASDQAAFTQRDWSILNVQ